MSSNFSVNIPKANQYLIQAAVNSEPCEESAITGQMFLHSLKSSAHPVFIEMGWLLDKVLPLQWSYFFSALHSLLLSTDNIECSIAHSVYAIADYDHREGMHTLVAMTSNIEWVNLKESIQKAEDAKDSREVSYD